MQVVSTRRGSQLAFCFRLRARREQAGISLRDIEQVTKVSAALFADFERGDLRRWPEGLYRRAFVRAYAAAIGLPVESTAQEFVELFGTPPAPAHGSGTPPRETVLRLTLVGSRSRPDDSRLRALAALLDLAGILALALVAAWLGAPLWTAAALLAAGYGALTTGLMGRTLSLWWLAERAASRRAPARPAPPLPEPGPDREPVEHSVPLLLASDRRT